MLLSRQESEIFQSLLILSYELSMLDGEVNNNFLYLASDSRLADSAGTDKCTFRQTESGTFYNLS